jgi:hypothetical protein
VNTGRGAKRLYLMAKYGVSAREYPLLLALAREEYAEPVPTIINNYHAPVTQVYDSPKPEAPINPVYLKPMPGTVAFERLPFAERIQIQAELSRLQRESN